MISLFFCTVTEEKVSKEKDIWDLERFCGLLDWFAFYGLASFYFSFCHQKEKDNKKTSCWGLVRKKTAGCRSGAKKSGIFLNEKNSLRSNSFSFFTGNTRFLLTLLHGGRKKSLWEANTSLRSQVWMYPSCIGILTFANFVILNVAKDLGYTNVGIQIYMS